MKATVLLSSYNGEKYIREQIDSILAQDCPIPFDLWVRDDGSTDSTQQILQQYALEGKLQWYTGDNLRPAKSFLDLVHHCPGYDYYAFADQDDYWFPQKLAAGINQLTNTASPALYFSNAQLVDNRLQSLGRNVYTRNPYHDYYTLMCEGGLLGCTMVFNSSLAELIRSAPIPKKLIMHDFYIAAVCALFDGQILYDSIPHMQYRQHNNNVVGVSRSKWQALRNRFHAITQKMSVTVDEQAQSLLVCYPKVPDKHKHSWLKKIAQYRNSFVNAFALAISPKTHYCSKNKAITLRLALLLRNR